MFAGVVIDINHKAVDRVFTYRIPESLLDSVAVGKPVRVPFGSGNRLRKGYVVSVSEKTDLESGIVKEIDSVLTNRMSVEEQLVALAIRIRERYGGTLFQCISTTLPAKAKYEERKQKILTFVGSDETLFAELETAEKKKHYAKLRLLEAFSEKRSIPQDVVSDRLNVTSSTIRPFVDRGLVTLSYLIPEREKEEAKRFVPEKKPLNEAQQDAVRTILSDPRPVHLLFGVTGSGKTEVYMELIERTIESGKDAIVLIPEIALTYQTVMRFYNRFGGSVSFVHSRLKEGEKAKRFQDARDGRIKIMIGPRSALFTPFSDLGLIVVDECHEQSYHSDQVPKYDAVDVAIERALFSGAKVVLGSASPSVVHYERALSGEFGLEKLTERAVKGSVLPDTEIIDMREELRQKNRSILSRSLQEKIRDRLAKSEQVMLFLNRRGYTGAVSCRSCGEAVTCVHCSTALTQHRNGRLKCHICGYERAPVRICPKCGSKLIGSFGIGTEKAEEIVRETFPGIRTLRMDADTTAGKEGHQEILEKFIRREADVLVGTQMIVKGHDFPNVTLVG
ncbi:MAG: primosomal protein N', partial [Lachnospiraceae bacterium]|nr:primosomal protein N' [Lachnospiraceae bacterium]